MPPPGTVIAGVAACVWLASRLLAPLHDAQPRFPAEASPAGAFLHFDPWGLALIVAAVLWTRGGVSRRAGRWWVGAVTACSACSYAGLALGRYWGGQSMAWDLATFVQPMWRFAHGLPMTRTWRGEPGLWSDHGTFAFFVFAPLTRIADDPATALLVVQSLVTAAFIPVVYAAAQAMGLARSSALCCAFAAGAGRAIQNAAGFDFHPEHLLSVLLGGVVWAHARGRGGALLGCTLAAALLKDMAALTVGGACMYLAWRDRRRTTVLAAALALTIAVADILLLPRLTGISYLASTVSAKPDLGLSLQTTVLRALSAGGLGFLHPFAWLSGGPWVLAAGWSSKLATKGIEFQYGFLWYPVGMLGAVMALDTVRRWRPPWAPWVACAMLGFTALVNAPRPVHLDELAHRHDVFTRVRAHLARRVPLDAAVASDACVAPLLIDHLELRGLCQIDWERYAAGGGERWDQPAARALEVDRIVVDRSCHVHGACLAQQLRNARAAGFHELPGDGPGGRGGRGARSPYLVLTR